LQIHMTSPSPKKDPPTLKHVAMTAGVHPSTVSRALDPARRHLIAPDRVRHIEETAFRLGYHRNIGAAALRTGRTRLIGVILPDVANPVFGPILAGVEEAIAIGGYSAIVANASGSGNRAMEAAQQLIARNVEGLVVATAELADPLVTLCTRMQVPIVLVNRAETNQRVPSVISDDREGMRLAVAHLVQLGHSRIGHLAGPQNVSTGVWRREGFVSAMQAFALPAQAIQIAASYSRGAGEEATRELLASHRVTAIAAANDLLALGAFGTLARLSMRCPDDVSIVGYNDMPLIDIVDPPLTSVRIASSDMGGLAGQRILAAIAGASLTEKLTLVQPSLVIRKSTRRLLEP
jgi:LacI family transcriptional regulator